LDERNAEEDKTVPTEIPALGGGKKVELHETQRAVTLFGELVVLIEFLRQVGYIDVVIRCLPFRLTSPTTLDPAQTFTAFLLAVLAGARRFAHASLLPADTARHQVRGLPRFPGLGLLSLPYIPMLPLPLEQRDQKATVRFAARVLPPYEAVI
jgi:hypothetical protein